MAGLSVVTYDIESVHEIEAENIVEQDQSRVFAFDLGWFGKIPLDLLLRCIKVCQLAARCAGND